MSEHVLLLHGLWMRGFALLPLRRRLCAAGFVVHIADYASVMHSTEQTVTRLVESARRFRAQRLHLVGHSLGGLIALKMLERARDLPPGNVVCIGSPLLGSATARGLVRSAIGRRVLGKSREVLSSGLTRWDCDRPLGVVAGSTPVGIGALLVPIAAPHDGAVVLAETQLPGLTDHCIVPCTHTGLLFCAETADQIVAFLRNTRFAQATTTH